MPADDSFIGERPISEMSDLLLRRMPQRKDFGL
jgi:hypothetical protein